MNLLVYEQICCLWNAANCVWYCINKIDQSIEQDTVYLEHDLLGLIWELYAVETAFTVSLVCSGFELSWLKSLNKWGLIAEMIDFEWLELNDKWGQMFIKEHLGGGRWGSTVHKGNLK